MEDASSIYACTPTCVSDYTARLTYKASVYELLVWNGNNQEQ